MEIAINHGDHGVPKAAIEYWLRIVAPDNGFFAGTRETPYLLKCGLHGPLVGDPMVREDEVFYRRRTPDRPPSRLVSRPPRDTRLLTVVGRREGDFYRVFTAYGGPLAPREPGDRTLKGKEELRESIEFWTRHALSADPNEESVGVVNWPERP